MLQKILEEIKKGETTSPVELASRLNTSIAMVEAMLDTLERQGYLKTLSTNCPTDNPCESCSLGGICASHSVRNARIRVISH